MCSDRGPHKLYVDVIDGGEAQQSRVLRMCVCVYVCICVYVYMCICHRKGRGIGMGMGRGLIGRCR
jgi:hypothetical protein